MTLVKVKLELSKMQKGERLDVFLKGKAPMENVPRSLKEHGHTIIGIVENSDGTYKIEIEK
jgi:TusA-related sulfurtransferase